MWGIVHNVLFLCVHYSIFAETFIKTPLKEVAQNTIFLLRRFIFDFDSFLFRRFQKK